MLLLQNLQKLSFTKKIKHVAAINDIHVCIAKQVAAVTHYTV